MKRSDVENFAAGVENFVAGGYFRPSSTIHGLEG